MRHFKLPLSKALGLKRVVVATYGEGVDMSFVKLIHKPILLANSPRPKAGKVMSKGFWFSQTGAGIATQLFLQNCAEILVHLFVALAQIRVRFRVLPSNTGDLI